MVGYSAQNQYRIYDPACDAVYVRGDVRFNERAVGPPKPITTYNNSFHDKNTGNTAQIFPFLSSETEQRTRLTPADKNLTLYSTSSPAPANFTPIQTLLQNDGSSSTLLHVPAITHDTANTETRLPTPTQGIPVLESPPPVPTIPDRNQVSGTFENSDNDLNDSPMSEKDDDSGHGTPRQSACTGANQVDYKKYFQKGKAAKTKTNSSVPNASPHSEGIRVLFDYALSQPGKQVSRSFFRVAQKKAKASTPDIPFLKNALKSDEADALREAMRVEYEALIANGTWVLVDCPNHQHVLSGKWAFKQHRDINSNIKKYRARWVGRCFQQREEVDYFETYASVVKAATNKALFAVTAHKRLHFHECDAITAFPNSQLWEEVYIEQPEFFHNGNSIQVLMLLKAVCGLKQSARLWFDTFANEMKELRFFQSHYDHTPYLDHNGTHVDVYVDDLQIVGPDHILINRLKTDLVSRFKKTDRGLTSHYLGMEVMRNNNTITMTQIVYID